MLLPGNQQTATKTKSDCFCLDEDWFKKEDILKDKSVLIKKTSIVKNVLYGEEELKNGYLIFFQNIRPSLKNTPLWI